ncbi:hypothetical protein P886_3751 [Alteromonadaceae bacterium 2753L.S.0a.02]|nr:hypothetical protein P886_3751 [Alteromonadaceae bacterium 2753L.S.0a.02]
MHSHAGAWEREKDKSRSLFTISIIRYSEIQVIAIWNGHIFQVPVISQLKGLIRLYYVPSSIRSPNAIRYFRYLCQIQNFLKHMNS